MTLTKAEFGQALIEAVNGEYDETDLANWAYEVFLDHANKLEPGLYEAIMQIVALESDDEFFLTRSEIQEIGRGLTNR